MLMLLPLDTSSSPTTRQMIPGVSSAVFDAVMLDKASEGRTIALTRTSSHTDDQGHHDEEDEYGTLLDYVAKVSERKAHPAGVNEDGSYEKQKRKWYAPWKKYTVKYDRNGEVIPHDGAKHTPEDWCVCDSFVFSCSSSDIAAILHSLAALRDEFPKIGSRLKSPRA